MFPAVGSVPMLSVAVRVMLVPAVAEFTRVPDEVAVKDIVPPGTETGLDVEGVSRLDAVVVVEACTVCAA
jgi:hypothetical protein